MGNLIICTSKTFGEKMGMCYCSTLNFLFSESPFSYRKDLGTKIAAKTRPQISESDKNETTVFGEDP